MIKFWIRTMFLISLIIGNNIHTMAVGNEGKPADAPLIELEEFIDGEITPKDVATSQETILQKSKKTNYTKLLLSAGIGCLLASAGRDVSSAITHVHIDKINALASPITVYPCALWDMYHSGSKFQYDDTIFYFPTVEEKQHCTYEEYTTFSSLGDEKIPHYAKGSSLCIEGLCCGLIEDCDNNGEYKEAFTQSKKSSIAALSIGIPLTILTSATHLFFILKSYCCSSLQT